MVHDRTKLETIHEHEDKDKDSELQIADSKIVAMARSHFPQRDYAKTVTL